MTEGSGRYGVRRSTAAQAHFNNRILRVCLFTEAAPVWGVLGGEALAPSKETSLNVGQVSKGLRWMPWGQGPKKGVARLRKASACCLASVAGGTRMGKPFLGHTRKSSSEEGKWGN